MPAWRKLLYSLGSLGAALPNQALTAYAVFYYVDVLHTPALAVGTAMSFYGLWNAVNDPLLGYLSDRTRTRWGRRIPYIAAGVLPLALCYAFFWAPPPGLLTGSGPAARVGYFAGLLFAYDFFYSMVVLNWTALFPEMFQSLQDRASVSVLRQLFALLGTLLGLALTTYLASLVGWPGTGVLFAAVSGCALALSLLGARENPALSRAQALPLGPALRYTLANPAFVSFALTSLTTQLAINVIVGSTRFYTKYVLGLGELENSLVTATAIGAILLTLPLWARRTTAVGPRRAMMDGILLFLVMLAGFWVAADLTGALVAAALVGLAMGALVLLWDVLIADVIDDDEVRSGVRREGMYFGMHALILRVGVSIQGLIITGIPAVMGYDPRLAVQPDTARLAFRLLMTAVPAGILSLALLFIYFYPLHGPRLQGIRESLARKREQEKTALPVASP